MELGFALPHLGPIASRDNIRQVAVEAERLGYHSLWTNERLLKPVNPKTPYPGNPEGVLDWQYETVFEHLTALTYASALTERIRLGVSLINLPFHNPVQLAKRIATMDHLSNGRIDVGLGLGWSEDEADVTNTPFATRGRRGGEYIQAMKALWAPDPVEFHGDFVDVPLTEFGPKPVQAPHPPLYMGAFAPVALTRAGRIADGFTACCAPVDAILQMRRPCRTRRPPRAATARRCRPSCAASCTAPTSRCPTRAARSPTGPGSRSTRTACGSTRPASR